MRIRDHPRSRGVYVAGVFDGILGARIIPARAGFTSTRARSACTGSDHPRSRGVYRTAIGRSNRASGSSPLARGLRNHGITISFDPRIIPARAGFTPDDNGTNSWFRDHPRSRGVYQRVEHYSLVGEGSSPLARGLHGVEIIIPQSGRIIPARAGFTLMRRTPWCVHRDHPRSRGVYQCERSLMANVLGSSPLARGLRATAGGRFLRCGIIPARAGFTVVDCR